MESKYYKWSKDKMKMIINSDFVEFNKQTNCISQGNVIANTMYGKYIRPYNETICNGQTFPIGHLFNYDLKYFRISQAMKEYIKSLNKKVVLYEIFIYRKNREEILGHLIEDNGRIINITVAMGYKTDYNKRFSALETVKNIIEEKNFNRNGV